MAGLLGTIASGIGGLLGVGGGAPQGQAASAGGYPAPPPPMHGLGPVGDILDGLFLGGKINAVKRMEYAREIDNYNRGMMYQELPQLTPQQRIAALFNGPKFGEEYAKNFAPVTTPEASTSTFGGGAAQGGGSVFGTRTGIDEKSGMPYAMTPQGIAQLGPSLGGDFKADQGLIMSGRTGPTGGTYSTNAPLPAGQTPGQFMPQVNGGPQFNGLPNLFAPPQAGSAPSMTMGGGAAIPGRPGAGLPPQAGSVDPGFSRPITNQSGDRGFSPPATNRAGDPGFTMPNSALAGMTTPSMANAPLPIRQNNPGALMSLPNGQTWQGQTGVGPGGHAIFATPQDGLRAAMMNLQNKQAMHGLQTINDIIAAPGVGWDPGNTSYVKNVSALTGIPANQKVNLSDPATLNKVADAIFSVESGPKAWQAAKGAFTGQGAPAASAAAPGGVPAPQGGAPGQGAPARGGWQATGPAKGYQILTADQVPNGKPGWTYKAAPDGDITPIPPEFTMEHVLGNRAKYYGSEQYKMATNAVAPLQALYQTVDSVAPGGVVGMAALDTLNKNLNPGGVVRPQTAQMFLDHLGLPEEAKSFILSKTGNTFMSPKVITDIGRAGWLYTKSHIDQAAALQKSDTDLAVGHGYKPEDVGETVPEMPPVPRWAQDALPPPNQRSVGKIYWSPKGPAKWTAKGWVLQ